ncbi:MAG: hypothetical protein EPN38_10125 [Rhodanobacteraceae bacterium]|nr:MAG: hypothetical protein EPN38_10125 [Rhodanobacteraceae bacterium]
MIRIGWVAAACLWVAACGAPTRQAFPRHYTLAAVTAGPAPDHAAPAARGTLRIARIETPAWLQGREMYYRLQYHHDQGIAAYARSDWAAPPATLLEPVLAAALVRGGGWRAVVGPATPGQAACTLQIRLNDFSQVFSSPAASAGVLDATATLVANASTQIIAQTGFHLRVAAPSADAAGGAKALNRAAQQFTAHLQAWLARVKPCPAQR